MIDPSMVFYPFDSNSIVAVDAFFDSRVIDLTLPKNEQNSPISLSDLIGGIRFIVMLTDFSDFLKRSMT